MKNQFTAKRLIVGCIVFALGLMTLLALCIPLLQISDNTINILISKNLLDIKTYESGFTLLDFESSSGMDEEMAIICGIFSLLQLLLSISTMILAVLCIFVFDKTTARKILRGFAISCLVFIGFYMIWGILFSALYKYLIIFDDGSWGLFDHPSGYHELYITKCHTLAYIGFIIGVLMFVAYVVCSLVLKDDMRQRAMCEKENNIMGIADKTKNETRQADVVKINGDIVEVLKQYKALLDSGIITQEEFERKKQEILANS